MDSQDNVIVFPVPKPKFDFGDLYDFVVYSDDKGLVTGCHCFDCKVVHICGYLSISNDEYELVEELDSHTLQDGGGKHITLDDHIDVMVGRINRRQGKVWSHSLLSDMEEGLEPS